MSAANIKQKIQSALQSFSKGNLTENALNLFQTLGYNTERRSPLDKPTFAAFKESFIGNQSKFNEEKAMVSDWKYVDLLFQLSKEEILKHMSQFDTKQVDRTVIETYLFFTIELAKEHYSRTALSHITREVNRLFPMPVMILFKYGSLLTLSVINRRLHKRDDGKDALEKVTLIKDIRISPTGGGVSRTGMEIPLKKGGEGVVTHRAHIEILFDLSFDELKNKYGFTNFVELHNAWWKTLDTKELNKRFYEKLFYWYLWTVKKVRFPQIRPKEDLIPDEAHQNESVIRLLTRLLFCWFMKEKQELIPELLFDKKEVKKILIDFSPENEKSSVFYRAILQNLFFATLSVPIKKRKYIRESFQGKNQDYGNQYVYRYQGEFADAKENLKLFKDIPFLNGGLFECLDEVPENDDEMEIRLDGFSSKEEKQAFVPDYLFWDEHNGIDLSEELDNPRKKNETVYGIIDILNSYKFTIEENTPLEEEVALDPELLGRVFESLLAYYNPETKANARKQTGSFYTPREIVNYLVDESLVAAFRQKLSNTGITENVELRLRNLISYNETENPFTEMETNVIIQALENLKVLDPACGSGAFPMGILHKLVWILRKVDPENKIWFESIIKRLPTYAQPEMRKKLEGENWDYLRKLGVVQQSVYGVDIQPIAIQIAKLRFFISLLVDQDIKGNDLNNFGLLPLPNLDFKLVSANTLIGAPEQNHQSRGRLFFPQDEFFDTFNKLTGQYFGTSEPAEKKKLSKKIEKLVSGKMQEKVAEIQRLSTHADERFSKDVAEKNKALIEQKKNDAKLWKSYNNLFKHESVGFFEIKYFFPEAKERFDVVIGNPPYVQIQSFSGMPQQKDWEKQKYETYTKTGDVYCLFYERGYRLLKDGGVLTFITSNKWMRANYGKVMRKFFAGNGAISQLIDFGDSPIFENATTYTNILVWMKDKQEVKTRAWDLSKAYTSDVSLDDLLVQQGEYEPLFNENSFVVVKSAQTAIKKRIEEVGVPLKDWDISINYGIKTGLNEAFIIDRKKRDELIAKDQKSAEIIKPILRGRDIKRYKAEFADLWLIASHNGYKTSEDDAVAPINLKRNYPVIYQYLDNVGKAIQRGDIMTKGKGLFERDDQGSHWSNLRDCAYYKEFEIDKIVWLEMSPTSNFTYDIKKYFVLNTAYILTGKSLKYLTAVINSKVLDFYFPMISTNVQGQTRRYIKQYVELLPVPQIASQSQLPFETLVDCILFCKEHNLKQESDLFESVIDGMVYELYFLDEIKAADCEVLKHVAKLPEFKNDWSDEKKLAIIEKVYKDLSDSKHPISVAMAKMQEIPAVKLIERKE